ncbi:hypothetical protein FACS189421_00290 [Bacteroidia bacterium]|nr:hypothetical protein FACS189421_00290 [Bacteroidia bacterium]GHT47502.1 hypothetical protein FACS189440_08220 [Bacteroidia bacterium]
MKTIAFYSYKGGVGRTLALVNIANRLAEFGKKVCIMDFDLEAPGLNHKYKRQIDTEIKQGLVDYIYEFAVNDVLLPSIQDYSVEINTNEKQKNITFIPAGDSEHGAYWKKLSHISWWNLFYEEKSEGIPFFLDLKEKIKKEINPDYLLIDNRTGITETSALTLSLLADSIVLLAVNNEENICGTQRIIEAITKKENNLLGMDRDIHFALTRIPFQNTPEGRSREYEIKNLVERKIEEAFKKSDKKLKSFNVIHSDREIELFEKAQMNFEYLSLFNSLTGDDFSPEGKNKFDTIKRAEGLLRKAYDSLENLSPELLKYLDEIEKIAPDLPDSYFLHGWYYNRQKEYKKAVESFTKGIELGDILGRCLFFRSESNYMLRNYSKAVDDLNDYINKKHTEYRIDALMNLIVVKEGLDVDRKELILETSLLIEKYPYHAKLYNVRSCLYNQEKHYESALEDIYKAIDLDPQEGVYYATLAEIKFCKEDKLEFYRNFDEALRNGYDIERILFDDDVKNIYKQVLTDSEFIRILNKYDKVYFIELMQKKL